MPDSFLPLAQLGSCRTNFQIDAAEPGQATSTPNQHSRAQTTIANVVGGEVWCGVLSDPFSCLRTVKLTALRAQTL